MKAYTILEGDDSDYKKMTEFEAMKYLEEWRQEDNKVCEFCGSRNVEVLNISVNGYSLYSYDRLISNCDKAIMNENIDENMFMINLQKSGSEIKLDIGGINSVHRDFLKLCLFTIKDIVMTRGSSDFRTHRAGNFFICLSGGFDFDKRKQVAKVEKYSTCGLSREEVLSQVNTFALKHNISIA
jgi:hypothetical protein